MQTNPSLTDLAAGQQALTQLAESLKADLQQAKDLVASCESRLYKLIGEPAKNEPQKSLRTWIHKVLGSANEPLTVAEICELVLEQGYKTKSQTFANIVYQTITKDAEIKRKTRPKTKPARYALEEV